MIQSVNFILFSISRTVLMVRLGFQPSARCVLNICAVPSFAHLASGSVRCGNRRFASSYSCVASTSFPRLRLGEVSPWSRRLRSSSNMCCTPSILFSLIQKERRSMSHVPLVVSAFGGFDLGPVSRIYSLFLHYITHNSRA